MKYLWEGEEFDNASDYIDALKNSDNRYNAYSKWSEEADAELLSLSETVNIKQLADHFKRMPGGITSRLRKLNELSLNKKTSLLNLIIFRILNNQY